MAACIGRKRAVRDYTPPPFYLNNHQETQICFLIGWIDSKFGFRIRIKIQEGPKK